jgi:hypothetical protein
MRGDRGFDDRVAQAQIVCPQLCFVASADEVQYSKKRDDTFVSLAKLRALGRDVCAG